MSDGGDGNLVSGSAVVDCADLPTVEIRLPCCAGDCEAELLCKGGTIACARSGLREVARQHGWRQAKKGSLFLVYCPDCYRTKQL